MAEGIRLRRTRGWRLPLRAVNVARPSKWGNPFRVLEQRDVTEWGSSRRTGWRVEGPEGIERGSFTDKAAAIGLAVELYDLHLSPGGRLEHLLGDLHELVDRDLACWCPIGATCHRDVLLTAAERARTRA